MFLEYILELKQSGLSTSTVKVNLAAITALHHKIDGVSVFTHLIRKHFLTGIQKMYPEIYNSTPAWDLNLVLRGLTKTPFESTCGLFCTTPLKESCIPGHDYLCATRL